MSINKKSNAYADELGEFFEKTPKAVFAALASSFIRMHHGFYGDVEKELWKEWQILNQNGIIPQKPPRRKSQK